MLIGNCQYTNDRKPSHIINDSSYRPTVYENPALCQTLCRLWFTAIGSSPLPHKKDIVNPVMDKG